MVDRIIAGLAVVMISGFSIAQQTDSTTKKALADAAWARAGCGSDDIRFDVRIDKTQHVLAQPKGGQALVYVFEDDLTRGAFPTTRVGIDGKWIGANVPESYLFFAVAPGVRRLCSNWQGTPKSGAALDFTAEAGKSYFFRAKIKPFDEFIVEQVAEAEGHFLIANHGLSTYTEKPSNAEERRE
jgi:hypothetical protein